MLASQTVITVAVVNKVQIFPTQWRVTLFANLFLHLSIVKVAVAGAAIGLNWLELTVQVAVVTIDLHMLTNQGKARLVIVLEVVDVPIVEGVAVTTKLGCHLSLVLIHMTAIATAGDFALEVSACVTLLTINLSVGSQKLEARHGVVKLHSVPVARRMAVLARLVSKLPLVRVILGVTTLTIHGHGLVLALNMALVALDLLMASNQLKPTLPIVVKVESLPTFGRVTVVTLLPLELLLVGVVTAVTTVTGALGGLPWRLPVGVGVTLGALDALVLSNQLKAPHIMRKIDPRK